MVQSSVSVSEFKAKCLRLIDEIARKGTTVVLTKRGKPVAKVVPLERSERSLEGRWAGLAKITGDIVSFDTSSDWEVLRDEDGSA